MIRNNPPPPLPEETEPKKVEKTEEINLSEAPPTLCECNESACESKLYSAGDCIDYMDPETGSWFEGLILDIVNKEGATVNNGVVNCQDLIFKIQTET